MRPISYLVCFLVLAVAHTGSAAVIDTFDDGFAGWRISGDNESVWSAVGGNPGGCIDVNDLATGARNDAVAPLRYLGDWSAATASDTLRFDVFTSVRSGSPSAGSYTFRIAGPGGSAVALEGFLPPFDVWTTVSVPLDPAAWTIQGGTWAGILENVESLLLSAEYVNGAEDTFIDNVSLSITPVQEFEPCVAETFEPGGFLDWTFASTGGVTSPTTGGNSGGFLRIADGSGTSLAFAPSRFLGDWSTLDGSGSIALDLRLLSRAADPVDISEFIRLSGPGGVATVSLPAAAIPPSNRQWKRLAYPLEEAAWTVVSGSWAGLLAEVTEIQIQVEYVDGSEVVGLDNFARVAAGCADPDPGLVVVDGEFEVCGYESFVGADAIGFNPADDRIYVLEDASPGSGGGLYPLTGSDAGLRLQSYDDPADVLFTDAGVAFVSQDGVGYVNRYDPVNGTQIWASGFHSGDDDPGGLCFAPLGFDGAGVSAGDVIVADFGFSGPDEFWSFDPETLESERQIVPDLPGDPDFREITADPAGRVFAADALDATAIYELFADGTLQAIAVSQTVPALFDLEYSAFDFALYGVSNDTKQLVRIDPDTGAVTTVATGLQTVSYGALAVDARTGDILVSDGGANRVYRVCRSAPTSVESGNVAHADRSLVRQLRVWPNPVASGGTRIGFALTRASAVQVDVYDLKGRLVRRLLDGRGPAGARSLSWDRRDESGREVASGVYFVRVRADDEVRGTRVVIMR